MQGVIARTASTRLVLCLATVVTCTCVSILKVAGCVIGFADEKQSETKPYQSCALYPSELGLGLGTQPRVRDRQGKNPKYVQN